MLMETNWNYFFHCSFLFPHSVLFRNSVHKPSSVIIVWLTGIPVNMWEREKQVIGLSLILAIIFIEIFLKDTMACVLHLITIFKKKSDPHGWIWIQFIFPPGGKILFNLYIYSLFFRLPSWLSRLRLYLHWRRCRQTQIWSPGQEGALEEDMATHSNIPTWRIPGTEEPGGLQSIGSQRARHNQSNVARTKVFLAIPACAGGAVGI